MKIGYSTYGKEELKRLLNFCATQIEKWQIPNELDKALENIPWEEPDRSKPGSNKKIYVASDRFNFLMQLRNELENNVLLFADQQAKFQQIDKWVIAKMKEKVKSDVQPKDIKDLLRKKNYMSAAEFASWQYPKWDREDFIENEANYKHKNEEGIRNTKEKGLHTFPYFIIKKDGEICARLLPLEYFRLVLEKAILKNSEEKDLAAQILLWKKARSDFKRHRDNEVNFYADKSFEEYFNIDPLLQEIDNRIENLELSFEMKEAKTKKAKSPAVENTEEPDKNRPNFQTIAIYYRVTGKPMNKNNATDIARRHKFTSPTSGKKLFQHYNDLADQDALYFIDPDSKQAAQRRVKYFAEAVMLAQDDNETQSLKKAHKKVTRLFHSKY